VTDGTGISKRDARAIGRDAEDAAAAWLTGRGYDVLERNYRAKAAEADIIVRGGNTIAIVEVKARSSDEYGMPREAVTCLKQIRIVSAAEAWLHKHGMLDAYVRFDIIEVYPTRVTHIRGAFETPRALRKAA
jgi:putative endonuclease